ncbi:Sickle tail protein [Fukomys damarensis]|uniref:Sickle tail protein n=1 Tax=Fukomys damarensis TaxID=885580 RepID=A0A091EHZ1_FUKDA|nr:Sickle tail protein [Fukomys damarensis]
MQASEMDRKREAFLEHLKQKYPHHATAIMGHQERLRDQVQGAPLSPWVARCFYSSSFAFCLPIVEIEPRKL